VHGFLACVSASKRLCIVDTRNGKCQAEMTILNLLKPYFPHISAKISRCYEKMYLATGSL